MMLSHNATIHLTANLAVYLGKNILATVGMDFDWIDYLQQGSTTRPTIPTDEGAAASDFGW